MKKALSSNGRLAILNATPYFTLLYFTAQDHGIIFLFSAIKCLSL